MAAAEPDRSPVDLVLTPDEAWLLTANQTSDTVSLWTGHRRGGPEVPCGERPSALALTPDGRRVLVTGTFAGDLTVFDLTEWPAGAAARPAALGLRAARRGRLRRRQHAPTSP